MTQTLALAHPDVHKRVRCWCTYKELPDGMFDIYVINGAWSGKFNSREGSLIMEDGWTASAEIVWMGEVPAEHDRNYNDAIGWINEQLQKV